MRVQAPRLGPRERRLLLHCSRVELDGDGIAEVDELVRDRLDWEAVVFHARLHSVAALLHRHLNAIPDPERAPADARRRLLALFHRAAYQNRIFARENERLIESFQAAGVPVMVQKGLALLYTVYGNLALRPLIDLDFLVPPGRLGPAGAVLVDRGYWPRPVRLLVALNRRDCPQRWFVREQDLRVTVMVQEGLVSWPRRHRFAPDRLWAQARPARLGTAEALVLSPIDLLLYLCLHADGFGFFNRAALASAGPEDLVFAEWSNNRLIRFTDIHQVTLHHHGDIDWGALVAGVRAYGIEDAAHASLMLSVRLLGTPIPGWVLPELSGSRRPPLRRVLLPATGTRDRHRPWRRLTAAAWARIGARRQLDLFRAVGLLEVAFQSFAERTGLVGGSRSLGRRR